MSLGNILGGVIAGIFVDTAWGWSFFVPGAIVAFSGVLCFLFLVPCNFSLHTMFVHFETPLCYNNYRFLSDPEDLGFPPTDAAPKVCLSKLSIAELLGIRIACMLHYKIGAFPVTIKRDFHQTAIFNPFWIGLVTACLVD